MICACAVWLPPVWLGHVSGVGPVAGLALLLLVGLGLGDAVGVEDGRATVADDAGVAVA
ncbi:MAG TPA: hypothetical protein VGS17_04975 [Candidatus Limnocylindria bacterium]|nr:hypothetical protein [Candidatus Limnocylindria bacterium]